VRRCLPQSVPIGASLYYIALRRMGHIALVDPKFGGSGVRARYGLLWRTATACWDRVRVESEEEGIRVQPAATDGEIQADVST
jgi:hypothetical protein